VYKKKSAKSKLFWLSSKKETNNNKPNKNHITMKKQIFIALAVLGTVSFAGQLTAQDATDAITKQRTKSNNANERAVETSGSSACVGKIRCADGSCTITFEQEVVSPRDAASGLPTGKRMQ
jgi:hypothetical protein